MQPNSTSWISPPDDPDYPARDGQPIAHNTRQFDWIVTIHGAIGYLFRHDPQVVVAANLLWYPVEGAKLSRIAPATMVVFGRPKGDRGSYIQHREAGTPVHMAFEVALSGNQAGKLRRKLAFYERYGVEEYYVLDPSLARHQGYRRDDYGQLAMIPDLFGWTSSRLGIRFEMTRSMRGELRIAHPDGRLFESPVEIIRQIEESRRRTDEARLRTDAAHARFAAWRERADEATLRAERLLAQLRALGMEPEA